VEGEGIWRQFGASLDMLERAIVACPEALWLDDGSTTPYWYLVFHTLFWTDLYLSGAVEGFRPPPPFGLEELDPRGVMPERGYGQDELLTYLAACRTKLAETLAGLDEAAARRRHTFRWGEVSFEELLLYTMRHVQHHVGQLNLLLRQRQDATPGWVARTDRALRDGGG
jgi:hypothetical protein